MEVVDVEKLCYAAKITHITRRWENTDLKFLIEPFKDRDIFQHSILAVIDQTLLFDKENHNKKLLWANSNFCLVKFMFETVKF